MIKMLALAFFFEALLITFVPIDVVKLLVGKDRFLSILLSAAVGLPLPVNQISVVPILAALLEMGISRAIGMKRRHLKRMFLFEGGVYAVIAGLVGVLFGLVIAYLALWAIKDIEFGPQGYLLQYYTFTIPSLTVSFIAGFFIILVI